MHNLCFRERLKILLAPWQGYHHIGNYIGKVWNKSENMYKTQVNMYNKQVSINIIMFQMTNYSLYWQISVLIDEIISNIRCTFETIIYVVYRVSSLFPS